MRYLIFILAFASAWGQVESYGHKANSSTKIDMSAALSSRPVPEKASDPATCTEGMRYYNTTSHKGRICTSTNTWADEGGVSGILGSANGGTGNGFTKFTGPTTAEKTFTLPNASATITYTVFTGSQALGTSAITANACATTIDIAATGVASTDTIKLTESADWSGITGYGAASTDGLLIYKWPTTDAVHIKVCNSTGSSITPGAATVNVSVTR